METTLPRLRLTNWLGWVGRASWVVGRASCVIGHASSRRLLLVELKGTIFLYTTLCIHQNVCPIKFRKANLSAKYALPGPLPFSRTGSSHTVPFLMKCTSVQENHFRLRENSKIIAAFVSHSMSLEKTFQYAF